jgi:hypothetical protein
MKIQPKYKHLKIYCVIQSKNWFKINLKKLNLKKTKIKIIYLKSHVAINKNLSKFFMRD